MLKEQKQNVKEIIRMNVVIEGLPGTGKTSVINLLKANRLIKDIEILPEYLPSIEGDREDISFYIKNEKAKSELLENNKNKTLICDRYWQSSAIYCAACSNGLNIKDINSLYSMLYREQLCSNYIYIYLKIPVEDSLKRAQVPDVGNMWAVPSFAQRCSQLYDMLYDQIEEIDRGVSDKLIINVLEKNLYETVETIEKYLLDKVNG